MPLVDGMPESAVQAKVCVSLAFGSLTTAVATTLPPVVTTREPRVVPCFTPTVTTGGALFAAIVTVLCATGPTFAFVGFAKVMITVLPPPAVVVWNRIWPRRPLAIDTDPFTRS